jgi:hypothetical protein
LVYAGQNSDVVGWVCNFRWGKEIACRILVRKPFKQVPLRRWKMEWEINVNMYLGETCCEVGSELKWLTLCRMSCFCISGVEPWGSATRVS